MYLTAETRAAVIWFWCLLIGRFQAKMNGSVRKCCGSASVFRYGKTATGSVHSGSDFGVYVCGDGTEFRAEGRRSFGVQMVLIFLTATHLDLQSVPHLDLVLGATRWHLQAPRVCLHLHWFLHNHPQSYVVPGKCGMWIIQNVHTLLRHNVRVVQHVTK